ncbi:MAG: iron-containing redox enzyme family protein [Motiliproteus sp.]|nr:iron-containing redox enzyme family protein [Motiliproteus sp.]MCW9052627.1 iron-containing redox enzyme family protein [Motiliproteus sp.]
MSTLNVDFYQRLLEQTSKARYDLMALPVVQQTLTGDVTLARYRAFLTQAYHHVRHTVSLMMACGSRLSAEQHWIQPLLIEYINEEAGHEQWILNDLAAIGADPVEVISQGPSFATELMVAYAYDSIHRGNPISLFGMVHVLEGTSTALACSAAEKTQSALSLPDEAFSYLKSHGALDQEHVQFFADLVNRLDTDDDRQAVIHSANHHYKLYGNILNSLP